MKKSLLPLALVTALLGTFVSPLSVGATTPTPTWTIEWESQPVTGQPSPAFTFSMSGVVPVAGESLFELQLYVLNDIPSPAQRWVRSSGSNCSTAADCGILSVTYDGIPIDYTVQNWNSNQGLKFRFPPSGVVTSNGVATPGILDSGGALIIRVAAGQLTVPAGEFSGKPYPFLSSLFWNSFLSSENSRQHVLPNDGVGTESVAATSSSPGAPAPSPVTSAIDVNPTNITVDNEIITILGANLNTVTDVYIGGVRVPIFTQSGNRLQVRAPKGLSGLVDLELKSTLNDVLMTRKLNFGGVAAAGTKKRTLVVGGFAHNSRKLTARMQERIDRWLERNSDLGTLTCTGFTSLPRRTTDVTLSTNRGKTACNFSKRQRAELETSVSQGIEDPRPGSNVRRVRLVLTP